MATAALAAQSGTCRHAPTLEKAAGECTSNNLQTEESLHPAAVQHVLPDKQQEHQPAAQKHGAPGLTFDQTLKHVGECGRGQILVWLLASLSQIPNAVLILLLVFSVGSPVKDLAWTCSSPEDAACMAVYTASDPTACFCDLNSSQWRWTSQSTLTAQFNLVCADAWKGTIANSFFFVGFLIGSGLFGSVADALGRRRTLAIASATATAFAAGAAASSNTWVFLAMRLVTGFGIAGQGLAGFVLATESMGPAWRGAAGIMTQVLFVTGEFTLVLLSLIFKSWRSLAAAATVLNALVLLLVALVPESPRWLLVHGHREQGMQVLSRLCRWNRTSMPAEPLADIPKAPKGTQLRLIDVLKDFHIARRFFILSFAWMTLCATYYGIAFALSGLGGSLYLSFCISALAELPAYVLASSLIARIGRHNTMVGGMILGGMACIGCAFTPAGTGQAVLAAFAKLGIAGAFAVAPILTSELWPTLVRSAVLGAEHQAARVGGIAAPWIAMAAHGSSIIPFVTFGAASLLAGALVFTLPETLGLPLPETMQDMDAIHSIFSNKTWHKRRLKDTAKSMFKTHASGPGRMPAHNEDDDEDDMPADLIPAVHSQPTQPTKA